MAGALSHIRVLDLSRVLAGPWAAQNLGDLGADVIKIERPGCGDDTRAWGPPFFTSADGSRHDSGYFASVNRNKRSMTIDLASTAGQDLVREMAKEADVLIENYKVGTLAKYGLGYEDLSQINPRIVYCSVTGFGQTGPYRHLPGYDFIFQGMGGMMSYTGRPDDEPGGGPMKVGTAIIDSVTGLYATIAVLAALEHRNVSGCGQYIDLALLDCAIALNSFQAVNFFLSGKAPVRVGNAHPNMVPYNLFDCADGQVILAIGNNSQFFSFCNAAGHPELANDSDFDTVTNRLENRARLIPLVAAIMRSRRMKEWLQLLGAANVPCGPLYSMDQVFEDEQVQERGVRQNVVRSDGKEITLLSNPIRFSKTPVTCYLAPPRLGEHTQEVLQGIGRSDTEIKQLRAGGVI